MTALPLTTPPEIVVGCAGFCGVGVAAGEGVGRCRFAFTARLAFVFETLFALLKFALRFAGVGVGVGVLVGVGVGVGVFKFALTFKFAFAFALLLAFAERFSLTERFAF